MHAALDQLPLPDVSVGDLLGTWYIVRTNFPMWLKPRNTQPRFEYGAIEGRGDRMRDRVRYKRDGRDKQIVGVDRQDPELAQHFTWRGTCLLALLSSEWFVIDRQPEVAAILFTKTLFTPAGLDIITRAPDPDSGVVEGCLARLARAPALAEQLERLVVIPQVVIV